MKRAWKKAFTLVELLVVIAIIAVLSVVGIVGYTAFTKKAERSNDVGLITQINVALQGEEALSGKNMTFHEAREDVLTEGIDIAKIKLSSKDLKLGWDCEADRVVLIEGQNVIAPEGYEGAGRINDMFVVAAKEADVTGTSYNYYLADNFDATTLNVSVGIDVGNNVNINISYTGTATETRMFNTNGGTLTVNNPNSTIEHYGSANKAVITATANESYHCHANISGSIDVAQGHVVVENTAEVSLINVIPTTVSDAKVSLTYQPEARQDIPVMVDKDVAEGTITSDSIPATAPTVDLSGNVDADSGVDYTNAVAISTFKQNASEKGVYTYTASDFSVGRGNPLCTENCIANGTTEITLLQDVELNNFLQLGTSDRSVYDVILNLNGNTLTFTDGMTSSRPHQFCVYAPGKINLTVKNGTVMNASEKGAGFDVYYSNASIILEDIIGADGSSTFLMVNGSGAKATIKNCNLTASSFCVSTNAATSDHWEVEIDIENSTLTAHTPVMLNVPGRLNVTNSKLYGEYQAAFIRGGDATFTNCELVNTSEEYIEKYDFADTTWGTGNGANFAALTIGNKSATTAYHNPVNVTLTGCTLSVEGNSYPAIYAWSNNKEGKGVTITYSDCSIEGKIVLGGEAPTKHYDAENPTQLATEIRKDNKGVELEVEAENTYFANNYGLTHLTVNGVSYAGQTGPVTLEP